MEQFFQSIQGVGISAAVLFAGIFVLFILLRPFRKLVKLISHVVIGLLLLLVVNRIGGNVGIHLAMSWQNIMTAGIFGVPGVVLLIVRQMGW